jgi:hypothetical protein
MTPVSFGDRVSVKTVAHNTFLSVDRSGSLYADKKIAGDHEQFIIEGGQGTVHFNRPVQIRSALGKLISVTPSGQLISDDNGTEAGTFAFRDPKNPQNTGPIQAQQAIRIETMKGHFVAVDPNGNMLADRSNWGNSNWDVFYICPSTGQQQQHPSIYPPIGPEIQQQPPPQQSLPQHPNYTRSPSPQNQYSTQVRQPPQHQHIHHPPHIQHAPPVLVPHQPHVIIPQQPIVIPQPLHLIPQLPVIIPQQPIMTQPQPMVMLQQPIMTQTPPQYQQQLPPNYSLQTPPNHAPQQSPSQISMRYLTITYAHFSDSMFMVRVCREENEFIYLAMIDLNKQNVEIYDEKDQLTASLRKSEDQSGYDVIFKGSKIASSINVNHGGNDYEIIYQKTGSNRFDMKGNLAKYLDVHVGTAQVARIFNKQFTFECKINVAAKDLFHVMIMVLLLVNEKCRRPLIL